MARYFQFYVKKRGGRRTDSPMLGRLALSLFFALLLLVGVGFLAVLMVRLIVPEWRAMHRFVATRAVVLKTRPRPVSGADAELYRPDVLIQYAVDGVNHETWTYDIARVDDGTMDEVQAMLDRFVPGREFPCWYDPKDPDQAVLVRHYSWTAWLMTILPLSLVVVGGAGLTITLLNWGKSAERRAVLAQKRLNLELFEPALASNRLFPTLPPDSNLTNSPGTTLKFRLPLDVAPKWTSLVLSCIAIGVLLVAAFFAFLAIQGHRGGKPDWSMTIFATICTGVGLAFAGFVARNLAREAALGATIIEVSDHPWRPGEHYELFLNQGGKQTLSRLEMRLVCEERATYSQGTNTRTERACVLKEVLLERDELEVGRPDPFEARCEITLPTRAMHSFMADHNEVTWRLVIEGRGPRQKKFERSFPIVVYPPRELGDSQ